MVTPSGKDQSLQLWMRNKGTELESKVKVRI